MVTGQDLFLVVFLAFLEGILSIDNAIVLALTAQVLPPAQQKKALTYGLIGAVVFRLLALLLITHLMHSPWLQLAGGGYLVILGGKHLLSRKPELEGRAPRAAPRSFWKTVVLIEALDIVFAIDSILAAVALSNKLWVVFTGGLIGVIMIRFAAQIFLGLLKRFPKFESTGYQLVVLIGLKLAASALSEHLREALESPSNPVFYGFWALMASCLALGFRRKST